MTEIGVMQRSCSEIAQLTVHQLARRLVMDLGPALVAALAGVTSRRLPQRWVRPDGPEPGSEVRARLVAARRAWELISAAAGDDIARAWLIGANPYLGDQSPVLALRAERIEEVMGAASAFVHD